MTQVRMLTTISGARPDGTDWPERGYVLDTDDNEAATLIGAGHAAPLAEGRGKRHENGKDREQRAKAATAGDSRAAAAAAHARAAETRAAAQRARDEAAELEWQADEQEADAADAQDEADEAARAEEQLDGDTPRDRGGAPRAAQPKGRRHGGEPGDLP